MPTHTVTRGLQRYWRWVRGIVFFIGVSVVVDIFYLATIWPDWSRLANRSVPITKSRFIERYETQQLADRSLPVLRWRPVSINQIPRHLIRATVIAEDAEFFGHSGFDFAAMRRAFNYNLKQGKVARGASTISQQTAKNLFFTPSRNPLRKWHEAVLTWAMEKNLSKARILELYLNIVEFGPGIYGVDAASRAYWNKSVAAVTLNEAAGLAASLPSPKKSNPHSRSAFYLSHLAKIKRRLYRTLGVSSATQDRSGDKDGLLKQWSPELIGPADSVAEPENSVDADEEEDL
ncbi:MAG: monofunctional biosynthetic peptidoglycan transglycosylase [Gammaproteobacteria bacterium]|nr:monofunctional biosynthetic peptidoglycan transglycosylase [Gammaproteobacteria bacterium]